MSKTKRRYVVELTEAQLEALIDLANNGRETFTDDYVYWKKLVDKGDEAIYALNIAKLNGLKTIKICTVTSKNISTIHHGEQWTPYDKNGFFSFGPEKEMKVFKTKKECDEFIKIKKLNK